MKDILLIETLTKGKDSCEWCSHQCNDEDKYEMLVTCIRIQKECLLICQTVSLILTGNTSASIKNILYVFEKLTENVQSNSKTIRASTPKSVIKSGGTWKKPGCSQIFLIAQSLEQKYPNEYYQSD